METHFYTAIFFFLSLDFSYEHAKKLNTFAWTIIACEPANVASVLQGGI